MISLSDGYSNPNLYPFKLFVRHDVNEPIEGLKILIATLNFISISRDGRIKL